jgi:hypothetical protein
MAKAESDSIGSWLTLTYVVSCSRHSAGDAPPFGAPEDDSVVTQVAFYTIRSG